MKVYFFGRLASVFESQLDIAVDAPCTVGSLRRKLKALYPHGAGALDDGRVKALVGESVVRDDYMLQPSDEVEFLSPVSGG